MRSKPVKTIKNYRRIKNFGIRKQSFSETAVEKQHSLDTYISINTAHFKFKLPVLLHKKYQK